MSLPVVHDKTSLERTKIISVLSYMTIVGWLIALLWHGNEQGPLARYHLRQSLGLFVTTMVLAFVPLIGWLINILLFGAWCYGVYSAFIGHKYALPVVGDLYQQHLDFIS